LKCSVEGCKDKAEYAKEILTLYLTKEEIYEWVEEL